MRALRHIRPLLTTDDANVNRLCHRWCQTDYCNSLLYGCSAWNLDKLQKVQNQLARVVLQLPRSASATKARRQLHWLQVMQRINFKIATTALSCEAIWAAGVSLQWTWRLPANTEFTFGLPPHCYIDLMWRIKNRTFQEQLRHLTLAPSLRPWFACDLHS